MSAQEFMHWQGFLRRYPRGFHWENWKQAALAREVNRLLPRDPKKGDKLPPIEHFMWKPPEPLFVTRLKKKAKRKKSRE